MYIADQWTDYEALDAGGGEKLERWKDVRLVRPDPQAFWPRQADEKLWSTRDAVYKREKTGGGAWTHIRPLPEHWTVSYKDLSFIVRPTGFKHTGLFPEQAANWDWMSSLIKGWGRPVRALNLFGYTGGATCALAFAGAHVTHVDAAKGMVKWAQENRDINHIDPSATRFIVDDALKFVGRESRRGNRYDGVLMDPPSFGRGPNGEVWKLEHELYGLIESAMGVLNENPLFFLINSYTTGLQPAVLLNLLSYTMKNRFGGHAEANEVALPISSGGVLPCGASGRWRA